MNCAKRFFRKDNRFPDKRVFLPDESFFRYNISKLCDFAILREKLHHAKAQRRKV